MFHWGKFLLIGASVAVSAFAILVASGMVSFSIIVGQASYDILRNEILKEIEDDARANKDK